MCVCVSGTRDYTPFACIPSALQFRELLGGEQRVGAYCRAPAARAGEFLARAWGTRVLVSRAEAYQCVLLATCLVNTFPKARQC